MDASYEIVNTDLVEIRMSVTATREQWNGLRLGLPDTDVYCAALKGLVTKMLSANQLTVTSTE